MLFDQRAVDLHRLATCRCDILLDLLHVDALLSQCLVERLQGSLCAIVIDQNLIRIGVNVVLICLVDGVVGQVHECLFIVGLSRRLIACCAETSQSLIVDEGLNRVESGHDDVDSQVKFDAVEEQRVVEVPLHHYVTTLQCVWQVSQVLKQADRVALSSNFWLCNESHIWMGLLVCVEAHLLLAI